MTLVCTETQDKKPNEVPAEIPENYEHELIDETPYKMEIIWFNLIAISMMHLGALYSYYLCFFEAKFLTTFFGLFVAFFTGMSITMGAHRLYTHRAFKANKYVRFIIIIAQTMAAMKSMKYWVRDHRLHHKYSETNADPHNSKRGFFFSHVGWLMVRRHPDGIRKGRMIDISDMDQDPIARFQKNHYFEIFFLASVTLPTAIPCILWNETIWNSFFILVVGRIIATWNFTWFVNSFAHIYGSKPYDKNISPTDSHLLSLFTLGEGMHNFHHTFPWDYRGSEYANITTRLIDYCIKKGWAHDAKRVSQELIKRQAMKKGDSSHPEHKPVEKSGEVNG